MSMTSTSNNAGNHAGHAHDGGGALHHKIIRGDRALFHTHHAEDVIKRESFAENITEI